MTEPATNQSQEPMRVAYQAVIDTMAQVNANTDESRADELRKAANRAMDDYDRLVAEEKLRQRQATIDADAQARDAARRIAAGPGNDIARGDAPSDDNVFTLSDRRERSRLIYRHYFMEEDLSEAEQVRMHRQTNEERQFWAALRQPDKYAAINYPHLRVDPFPTDDVLRRAHNGQSYAGLMTGEGMVPDQGQWQGDIAVRQNTTQQVGTDADGGFLVPEGFQAELIRAMKAYGPLNDMRIVRVMPTAMGNPVKWPGMDDTGNKGALIAEHTATTYTTVGFSQIELNAYKYTTKAFAVTREAIQDTALPIQEIVRDAAAERVGRILNEHFTSADGSSKPQGVMTGVTAQSAQVINMSAANTLTLNDTLRVIHHIDPAYRQRRCRFMLNDNTALAYHQLTDGNTRHYFAPDVRDATVLRLFGYRVEINQDMDSIAAGKNAIIFGDFNKFLVRMVRGLTIRRLDELLALSDQVAFVGFMRCDSRVLDHRAFCVLDSDAS